MKVHMEESCCQHKPDQKSKLFEILDKFLVEKKSSNSALYSEKWHQSFAFRPTWCDADMALQQINRGMAKGNRIALYARSFFQSILFNLGNFVQNWSWSVIIMVLSLYLICSFGLQDVRIETDIVKLWVSEGGRLDEEVNFLSRVKENYYRTNQRNKRTIVTKNLTGPIQTQRKTLESKGNDVLKGLELPKESGLNGAFQVVIQTPKKEGHNVLNKNSLLKHVELMNEIAQYKVEMFGENWTLADICFKPPALNGNTGPFSSAINAFLDHFIPCIWITPIDCFWEGSKPLGPFPPLKIGLYRSLISALPKGAVSWRNLDPEAVLKEVGSLIDIALISSYFERSGIGAAYTDRWCINPLDPDCPMTSPNSFDRCNALRKLQHLNSTLPLGEKIYLEKEFIEEEPEMEDELFQNLFGRKKRSVNNTVTESDDYYSYDDDSDYSADNSTKEDKKAIDDCAHYGRSLLEWMNNNVNRWSSFLSKNEMPFYPDYGQLMTGGCRGFARNTMKWPEDLIIGGITRQNHKMLKAEAFQSVLLVASAQDFYLRFKDGKSSLKPNLDASTWDRKKARDIVNVWQRNFTNNLYNHPWNNEPEKIRVVHPLAGTSIEDMLEEFSQFKFFVIFIGYFLMCIYAGWSQLKWDGWWLAVDSCVGLSILGVLLVTYASISGLGFATWLGIQFNAATTQIVPFLTLGLGVDDMFLLLHNYNDVVHTVKVREIGVLMKETGMSIVITSTNNIIAFMAGTVLPIPALRSFCSQSAILLSFNLIAIMVIYPAFISLDLRRRKTGRRDLSFCFIGNATETKKLGAEALGVNTNEKPNGNYSVVSHVYPGPTLSLVHPMMGEKAVIEDEADDLKWYSLRGFLHQYYIPFLERNSTKMFVLLICSSMFLFGCIGLYKSTLGLELSDVLPEGTAPAAFLRAREKYFSFYPMHAILKGATIDFPTQQALIDEYRLEIARSEFVIKVDGRPSEEYWLSLMKNWLKSAQKTWDHQVQNNLVNEDGTFVGGNKTSLNVFLARALICSHGKTFNCSGRVRTIKLVDENGIINPDGFYNYLTAWYHIDNIMYYVSQASFFPLPPSWKLSKEAALIPPADPPVYSQIPFYLTKLVNTPVIVSMIQEIRSICEVYDRNGLPNFPAGLPFTFWEQYLHLRWHLFLAICVIASSVFIVISVLVFNPWAALMVMLVVVSMTIELAGFMGIAGVKLNPVSAVTLITAVGIGVEFTAHVVLAFLTSLGTKNERMAACMDHMFIPVIHGGLSTLLGIVMLAFSEFEFVIKYFFIVMTALIIIGLINGLILLPVLLSLIGPPCEVQPMNNANYLPVPPPLPMDDSEMQAKLYNMKADKVKGAFVEMQVSGNKNANGNYAFHDSLSTIAEEAENNRSRQNLPQVSQTGKIDGMKTCDTAEQLAEKSNKGVFQQQHAISSLLSDSKSESVPNRASSTLRL